MAEKSIGAFWEKQGKNGTYFTGNIEFGDTKVKVVVFKNTYKDKENQPDWRVFESKPRDGSGGDNKPTQPVSNHKGPEEFEDDEIPFF